MKEQCGERWRTGWGLAFWSALIMGLLTHLPVMLSDIPNHDGLDSMYFDQNMITSGRWFLTVACGFSSYYTLPWLIGLLALGFLALTAVILTELLDLRSRGAIMVCSGLLAVFPALASTFAYVFTMDGYMLGVLLAVTAVCVTARFQRGFGAGAVCLAFSLGIYQAYLPFAVILSMYGVVTELQREAGTREKLKRCASYLYMGAGGVLLYYGILQVLLRIQGKELASYQGISSAAQTAAGGSALSGGPGSLILRIYRDFAGFTLRGGVLAGNGFAWGALAVLVLAFLWSLRGIGRRWLTWGALIFFALLLPLASNLILILSPEVTYHLLMRYHWVLFPILLIAFVEKGTREPRKDLLRSRRLFRRMALPAAVAAGTVLMFGYVVTDNIAYSNLQKRYEKTYAYCLRLLDRIEQTPGYYQGIPIAMVGVVGDEAYPPTDITGSVTEGMIGIAGDSLLYRGDNYEGFIKNYLGATLNILPAEAMEEIYYSREYREMDSFPGAGSVKMVDGVIYVKTENVQ